MGALALLLRWARPQRLLRSISMRRKPMPWAVLAAASMEENTRQPPRCRSTTSVPALPKRTKCRWNPEPMGVGTIIALENPHVEHRLGLFFLHYQIPNLKHQIDNSIVPSREPKTINLAI